MVGQDVDDGQWPAKGHHQLRRGPRHRDDEVHAADLLGVSQRRGDQVVVCFLAGTKDVSANCWATCVDLATAKLQCKVDVADDDALITAMIASATYTVSVSQTAGSTTMTCGTAIYIRAYRRFAPNLPTTGLYKISMRFPVKNSSARSSVAPIDIVDVGGPRSLTLNQNGSQATPGEGGDWVVLTYANMKAGTPSANYVDVKTDGIGNGTVVSAVKFELVR